MSSKHTGSITVYNRTQAPIKLGRLDLRVPAQKSRRFTISLEEYGSIADWLDEEEEAGHLSVSRDKALAGPEPILIDRTVTLADFERVGHGFRLHLCDFPSHYVLLHYTAMLDVPFLADDGAATQVFAIPTVGLVGYGPFRLPALDGSNQHSLIPHSGVITKGEIALGLSSLREDVVLDLASGRILIALYARPYQP